MGNPRGDILKYVFDCLSFFIFLWPKNDTERICKYLKKPVLNPKRAKFNQKSGFWRLVCLLRLGHPPGGNWGNPNGPDAVQRFKTLYANTLEIPKGIPSQGIKKFEFGILSKFGT